MRKIITTDVFEAMRLIQRSGLREELVPLIKKIAEEKEADLVDSGILGFLSVLEVFSRKECERLIYELLSGPLEKSADDIASMDLDELGDNLQALAKENNLQRFFIVLSGLLTKKH